MNALPWVFLAFSLLTIWVEPRWAWGIFELGIFAAAGWRVLRADHWTWDAPVWVVGAAIAWPVVQLALHLTVSPDRTLTAALDWFVFGAVFLLTREGLADERARRLALRALSAFGMIVAAMSTLQAATSHGLIFWLFPSGFTDGVMGPFVNRNQYAAWVELILPAVLYLVLVDRRWRVLHAAAAAALCGSAVACASRAGFVLIGLELVAVAGIAHRRRLLPPRAFAIGMVQLVLMAIAAGTVAGWSALATRLTSPGSETLRREALRASLEMIRDRPGVGYGLGTWSLVYPRYASFDSGLFLNQAHNDWAQWAAEGGLPFLAILLFFAALLLKPAVRSIYGLGTLAVLLHALVDYPMQQRPALAAWFFALSGAALAGRKLDCVDDELLRRAGSEQVGFGEGDPPGLPPDASSATSRPVPGRGLAPARRDPDDPAERAASGPHQPRPARRI
jgi:hypothetical protein